MARFCRYINFRSAKNNPFAFLFKGKTCLYTCGFIIGNPVTNLFPHHEPDVLLWEQQEILYPKPKRRVYNLQG